MINSKIEVPNKDTCSREHLATGNVRVGAAGRYRFGSISLSGEIASGM